MVQKCVLLPTAPKRKASAKAPHTTTEASAAGLDSVKRPRFGMAPEFQRGAPRLAAAGYFFCMRRCLACSAAELEGYRFTRARSVSRAAGLSPSSDWEQIGRASCRERV